jgi:hypothetical protein
MGYSLLTGGWRLLADLKKEIQLCSSPLLLTVFLGAMVKPQEVTGAYDHCSVLRTVEDNVWLGPTHKDSGNGKVITDIWK